MRSKTIVIALPLLSLAGCVTSAPYPTTEQIGGAEIGPAPSSDLVEQNVREHLQTVLKDPGSLQLRVGNVQKGWYRTEDTALDKFAWMSICGVNAKNSYGGYTGEKIYYFYFLRDRLVAVLQPDVLVKSYGTFDVLRVVEVGGGGFTAEQAGLMKRAPASR